MEFSSALSVGIPLLLLLLTLFLCIGIWNRIRLQGSSAGGIVPVDQATLGGTWRWLPQGGTPSPSTAFVPDTLELTRITMAPDTGNSISGGLCWAGLDKDLPERVKDLGNSLGKQVPLPASTLKTPPLGASTACWVVVLVIGSDSAGKRWEQWFGALMNVPASAVSADTPLLSAKLAPLT